MNMQDQPGTYGPWGSQPPTGNGAAPGLPKSNTVGLVGFILSLLGLVCTLGLLSPIGALVSFFGLFGKGKPKGFAVAGVIIGLIGTLLLAFIGLSVVTAITFGRSVMQQGAAIGAGGQSMQQFVQDNGRLPDKQELETLIGDQLKQLPSWLGGTDNFQLPFEYDIDSNNKVTLTFAGLDEQLGTQDDVVETFDAGPWLQQAGLTPGASDPSQVESESTSP
jgi:hypothetical protein